MYASVRTAFLKLAAELEGRVPFMYLNAKGQVAIGVGHLVDPLPAALVLPFVRKSDGTPASLSEIAAEWDAIKDQPSLAARGHRACERLTRLRLTDAEIDALVTRRLDLHEGLLRGSFPEWGFWPADAQLAVLLMAWAAPVNFAVRASGFAAACKAMDFSAAAAQCRAVEAGNSPTRLRHDAQVKLFSNAAAVVAGRLHRSMLLYPATAADLRPPAAATPEIEAAPDTPTG